MDDFDTFKPIEITENGTTISITYTPPMPVRNTTCFYHEIDRAHALKITTKNVQQRCITPEAPAHVSYLQRFIFADGMKITGHVEGQKGTDFELVLHVDKDGNVSVKGDGVFDGEDPIHLFFHAGIQCRKETFSGTLWRLSVPDLPYGMADKKPDTGITHPTLGEKYTVDGYSFWIRRLTPGENKKMAEQDDSDDDTMSDKGDN